MSPAPRQALTDLGIDPRAALLDAAAQGDEQAQQKLVALTVDDLARDKVKADVAARKIERQKQAEQAAIKAATQGLRDQIAQADTEGRAIAQTEQEAWASQHLLRADRLGRLVDLLRLKSSLESQVTGGRSSVHKPERVMEWVWCRLGETVPGGVAVPYHIPPERKRMSLPEILGYVPPPTKPSTEAR